MEDPAAYEAWYHTPRGAWIARREFALMMRLMRPVESATLLDVGAGTGHFSRAFAAAGLNVTAIDPDTAALGYARRLDTHVDYLEGSALALPFADGTFDYCAAVTSLCFVSPPEQALAEMWRVARLGMLLGLLNRHSLLYRQSSGRGGYRGARWDTVESVRRWTNALAGLAGYRAGSAIFLPAGGPASRVLERVLPVRLPWGGFLAAYLEKAAK